jgi:Fe-S cluster assembly scaffold protein SufB
VHPEILESLKARALAAVNKKAAIGPDINLAEYVTALVPHPYLTDSEFCSLPSAEREHLKMAGMDISEKGRAGTYFQHDTSVTHCDTYQEGIEVMPIRKALAETEWIWDYYWRLVQVDTDKYTAAAELALHDGYVIRAKKGSRGVYPVQACLYIDKERLQQNVHNIIIAEEGSELHVITGCTTSPAVKTGLHVGISEFFVGKNATLSFTMIHNWAEDMAVRPRSVARVEEGATYLNNYICMKGVKSIQMYPTTHLVGEDAIARFYSIVVGTPGSEYDLGARIILKKSGNRGEIVARTITNGSKMVARGQMIGEVPGIKAHLECRGLILKGGTMQAIPELEGYADGVEMSHEAAVGRINQEEILYLMSRGLSEDEATATIVRGFLNVDIPGLPPELKWEIDRTIDVGNLKMM